jgi:hypothetical protein
MASTENTVCSICGRDVIHVRDALGGWVTCDPTLYSFSELSETKGKGVFNTLITLEGYPSRPGIAYPGSDSKGYRPHFYSCDSVEKAYEPALMVDRLWETGVPSVGPAAGSEGGGGELP